MGDCEHVCEALESALDALPIFPLGTTTFFPSTLLPLHIFEPRYRQMTAAALDTNRMIAVMPSSPDGEVAPIGGVGRIVHHELLDDGRYHILLQGLARVRPIEELDDDSVLYRQVRAELIESVVDDETEAALTSLRRCFHHFTSFVPSAGGPASKGTLSEIVSTVHDPGVVADVVCAAVLTEPERRLAALCERRVTLRLGMATEAMADLLLNATPPEAELVH